MEVETPRLLTMREHGTCGMNVYYSRKEDFEYKVQVLTVTSVMCLHLHDNNFEITKVMRNIKLVVGGIKKTVRSIRVAYFHAICQLYPFSSLI